MKIIKETDGLHFKWHFLFIGTLLAAIITATAAAVVVLVTDKFGIWPLTLLVFAGAASLAAVLIAIFAALLLTYENVKLLDKNAENLQAISEAIEASHQVLEKINKDTRLSEAAKTIIFRDDDRRSLREAIIEKLQQKDFQATYDIIEGLTKLPQYEQLANQFKAEADKYRDATDQQRVDHAIAHIEELFDRFEWVKASIQIERLIKQYPDSDKAKAVSQKMLKRKDQRKAELLKSWDSAIKKQDIDASLEVLKELDLYLTPNEGLALQESVREIFKTKLHNLGVQFSMEVSEKQWEKAFKTGQKIVNDFPNSRIAGEIREKMDVLIQKVTSS